MFWQVHVFEMTAWQVGPAKPAGQVQMKLTLSGLVHKPPLKHGFDKHGFVEVDCLSQRAPVMPAEQWQAKVEADVTSHCPKRHSPLLQTLAVNWA